MAMITGSEGAWGSVVLSTLSLVLNPVCSGEAGASVVGVAELDAAPLPAAAAPAAANFIGSFRFQVRSFGTSGPLEGRTFGEDLGGDGFLAGGCCLLSLKVRID